MISYYYYSWHKLLFKPIHHLESMIWEREWIMSKWIAGNVSNHVDKYARMKMTNLMLNQDIPFVVVQVQEVKNVNVLEILHAVLFHIRMISIVLIHVRIYCLNPKTKIISYLHFVQWFHNKHVDYQNYMMIWL